MKELGGSSDKRYNLIFTFILVSSILLRLGLALYNREANDPHIRVVRYIVENNSLPEMPDCPECFQPKLFHYTIAKLLIYTRLHHPQDADAQKVVAQLVNFLAGVLTLVVAWIFIRRLPGIDPGARILGFALLAFNPQLIGISSQVTNDALLILLCTLAVCCAYFFLMQQSLVYFFSAVIFGALAVVTKTNGWVAVIALTTAFFIKSFEPKMALTRWLLFAVAYPILVISLVLLNPLSQYVRNYQRFGSPVPLTLAPQPHPSLFEKTYTPYAGILSIQDGFFTFKLGNLLKEPVTPLLDELDGDSHRTSLWTRLYGSANSVHFENYPPSWRLVNQLTYWVYRGIFILALLPLAIMLTGAAREIYGTIKGVVTRDPLLLHDVSYGLFALLFVGYLLFVMLYAFEYRVYTVMKVIFTYPALLAFLIFFAKGFTWITSFPQAKKQYVTLATVWMSVLLIFYVLDGVILIVQLLPNQSGFNLILDRLMDAWY